MPTVAQIRHKIDTNAERDEQTKAELAALILALSPHSRETLRQFHEKWDGTRPFEEFVIAHNAKIKECLELECTDLGIAVRGFHGLAALTDETEISLT